MSIIGSRIKSVRVKLGLSQRGLSRLAQVSNDYISKIEAGSALNIGIVTLQRIATALELTIMELQQPGKTAVTATGEYSSRIAQPSPSYGLTRDGKTRELLEYWSRLKNADKTAIVAMVRRLADN